MLDDPNRDPIEVLADEFLKQHREGQQPTIEQFAAEYPEHSQDIIDLFPMIIDLERLKESDENSRPRPATTGNIPQKTLGDFQILSEIGRGGMGVVYLARQKSLGRSVALKVLSKSLSSSAQQVERFHREAEAAAGLHHTNIVPVYGVGNQDDFHYYAMQWIDGMGLDQVVEQLAEDPQLKPQDQRESSSAIRKRFSDSGNLSHASYFHNVARIGADIADALNYAHAHKVLHRDIKPSNVLLDAAGDPWITDFGLAKLADDRGLTQTGELIGTLRYMAPEQFEGHTDHRSDIYSLGLTLYELLTLQPAFNESLHAKLLSQRTRGSITPPRTLNPQIPRDLETIILTACSTEPVHRYQSAAELQADLQRFLEGRPVQARRISTSERLWRWCRRNPAIAISSGTAATLLLTVAVVSVVAYFQTHSALLKAQQATMDAKIAQGDAERSRARAEQTLNVAVEAFDSIFENLTRRGVPQSLTFDLGDDDQTSLTSVPTEEDAELLEGLLKFYERFAQQNIENERLQEKIVSAYHRMGLIQIRLGELEDAQQSLEETIKLAGGIQQRDPNNLFAIAMQLQSQNDLGEIKYRQSQRGRGPGAGFQFHEAVIAQVSKLSPQIRSSAEIQFQLARAYDLMGSTLFRSQLAAGIVQFADGRPPGPSLFPPGRRRSPDDGNPDTESGRGPAPGWDSLEQFARNLGIGPPEFSPDGPPPERPPAASQHDPAGKRGNGRRGDRNQRNRNATDKDQSEGQERGPLFNGNGPPPLTRMGPLPDIEKSISILKPLVEAQPTQREFASLLAKALQHRYVYLLCEREQTSKTTDAFLDAESQIRKSIAQQPNNPQLVLDLADHLSTANTEGTDLSIETVVQKIGDAVSESEKLCQQFPNVPEYQALLASAHRNLARMLLQQQDWVGATEHLTKARKQLESLTSSSNDKYYRWSLVATQLDQSQLVLEQGKEGNEIERRESFDAAIEILLEATRICSSIDEGHGPSTSQQLANSAYLKLADLYQKTDQPELAEEARRKVHRRGPIRRLLPFGF